MIFARSLPLVAMLLAGAAVAAGGCSSASVPIGRDVPGPDGSVHNGGTRTLSLTLGCGLSLPIVIDTPSGTRPIGAGPEDVCEFTCDRVYAGMVQGGACSDCGPGYGAPLGPGMTADIHWDRRAYEETMTDPQCSGGFTQPCALGSSVAPVASQSGVLTVCTATALGAGYCASANQGTFPFAVDTTQSEATIEVQ
jgi:hypothetical protein